MARARARRASAASRSASVAAAACAGVRLNVAQLAQHIGAQHVGPVQQRRIAALGPFIGQCLGDVADAVGLLENGRQRRRLIRESIDCEGGTQRIDGGVELARRHAVVAPAVFEDPGDVLHLLERVQNPAHVELRPGTARPTTGGTRLRAPAGDRPDCRCPRSRCISDRAGADRACRTSCRNAREISRACRARRRWPPAGPRRRCVPIQPNSRAAATDSRYKPMFVGEVRFAITACGISWKLSGGSMLCCAVTKVSKKLQVWRAMMRSRCSSSAVSVSRRAVRAGRLTTRATMGAHSHASRSGTAIQGTPPASSSRNRVRPKTSRTPPDMRR